MLSVDDLRHLARASMARAPAERAAMLTDLGEPDDRDVVAAAIDGLASDDRNVRVAMLRVLAWYPSEEAAEGILRGLRDPVRRVREVAAKSSRAFTSYPAVAAALKTLVESESDERVRRPAFGALAGDMALPYGPDASVAAFDALHSLTQADRFRPRVLFAALRAVELTDDIRALLEEIVRVGTKAEAVSATRALCGYRVARIEEYEPGERRHIKATCARASGDLYYWVPREAKV